MAVTRWWISKSEMEDKADGINSVRDSLHIETSDRMSWTAIRSESFMPRFGGEHPHEPGFFLDSRRPQHLKKTYWEVQLEYLPFKPDPVSPNPLSRPVDIVWSTNLVEQPTDFDNQGRFICNTAGEGITGVMQRIPMVDYSITVNKPRDPDWILTHFGAVNSDVVRIRGITWQPKTLLVVSGSGGPIVNENNTTYTEIKLSLLGDYRGWHSEVWNRGTVRLDQQDRIQWVREGNKLVLRMRKVWVPVPITSGTPPAPVDEPRFLDYDGQEIIDAYSIGETSTVDKSKVISLTFNIQKERPFNGVLPL
jgi:hypothetical protein